MVHCYNSFLRKSPFSFLRSYYHTLYLPFTIAPCRTEKTPSLSSHTREFTLFFHIHRHKREVHVQLLQWTGRNTHAPTHVDIQKCKKQCVCKHEKMFAQKKNGRFTIYRSLHLSFNNFKYFLCTHSMRKTH